MSPAKILTNQFRVRCGELWPNTVRLEETGVGGAVPIATVHQAVICIQEGKTSAAIALLRKRLKFGVKGQCDLTGWLMRDIGGEMIPWVLAVEIKAGRDTVSQDQADFHEYLRGFNVIVLVVRDVDQGISDLKKYAGPGEK